MGPAGINSAALLRGRDYINLGRGPAERIDFDVFPFNEGSGGTQVGHPVLRGPTSTRCYLPNSNLLLPGSRPALIEATAPSLF